jgi:hypothetical protein
VASTVLLSHRSIERGNFQMIVIEIRDPNVHSRDIVSKGRNMTFKEQKGVVDMPNGERRVISVPIDRDAAPYAAGRYTIADVSFNVNEWNRLEVGRLKLDRAPAATGAGASVGRTQTAG